MPKQYYSRLGEGLTQPSQTASQEEKDAFAAAYAARKAAVDERLARGEVVLVGPQQEIQEVQTPQG